MDHTQQNIDARIIRTDPLDDANWDSWRTRMDHILTMCGLKGYVKGEIRRPDPTIDSNGANIWAFKDNYAKNLITSNIGPSQMVHISQCTTAHEIWKNLVTVHDPKDRQTMISYFRGLFHTTAHEDDILEHLTKLKLYWDRINLGWATSASKYPRCISKWPFPTRYPHPGTTSSNPTFKDLSTMIRTWLFVHRN